LPSRSLLPHPYSLRATRASRSSRFVAGEVHDSCPSHCGWISPTPCASGDTEVSANPVLEVAPVQDRQIACSSRNTLNRFFFEARNVRRAAAFSQARSEYAGRVKSGV
jgi:hypothetical protein